MRVSHWLGLALCFTAPLVGAAGLDKCHDQFIDGSVDNAPTLYSSSPSKPYRGNKHLCYRANGTSYFALEYWPRHRAPRWVAYKITDRYGNNGCASRPRDEMRCYFKNQPWSEVESCLHTVRTTRDSPAPDPFHPDPLLTAAGEEALVGDPNPFVNTGHDRGHMAPNNAFSWDLCGTYHTFTMANMSPQRDKLNRQSWASLEKRVLYWGAEHGPVYVVTGTVFKNFPHERFDIYNSGQLDASKIYKRRTALSSFNSRNPDKNPDIDVPTGYFKVIYRPASNGEPAHAIGFLMPHTSERLTDYHPFISTIALIEEASGVRFPGIPDALKRRWGSDFLQARKVDGWGLRQNCGNQYQAANWLENSTYDERKARCSLD